MFHLSNVILGHSHESGSSVRELEITSGVFPRPFVLGDIPKNKGSWIRWVQEILHPPLEDSKQISAYWRGRGGVQEDTVSRFFIFPPVISQTHLTVKSFSSGIPSDSPEIWRGWLGEASAFTCSWDQEKGKNLDDAVSERLCCLDFSNGFPYYLVKFSHLPKKLQLTWVI